VRPETFANAVNITQTMQSLAFVTGPTLGGALIAVAGVGAGYAVFTGLSVASLLTMSFVRYRPLEMPKRALSLEAIKEGVRFVRQRQELLGAMTLDMFAVIFGGVKALMPVYAVDVLHVGATGYGILQASFEVGAFAASFVLLMRRPIERTGLALIWSVVLFGAATIVFGLSRNFYLSVLVYTLIGAADQVSVVMRSTTIQLATPDDLRGRVSAVNQVFIQSSNQLNAVESGLVASLTNAVFAVVSGGFGTLAVVGLVAWRMPALRRYRVPRYVAQKEAAPPSEPAPQANAQSPPTAPPKTSETAAAG
jgi:MFS family permease